MVETENFLPVITIILFFITIGCVLLFNFDVMQPSVILSGVMALSLLLGSLNMQRWELFVGSKTAIVVLTGIIAFIVGGIFTQVNYFRKDTVNCLYPKNYFLSKLLIIVDNNCFLLGEEEAKINSITKPPIILRIITFLVLKNQYCV